MNISTTRASSGSAADLYLSHSPTYYTEPSTTPLSTMKADNPTALQQATAPPEHPDVTCPHPELTRALPPRRNAAYPTASQHTIAFPWLPEVTRSRPWPVLAQQPTTTEVTLQPLDLEVTITQLPASCETVPLRTEQSTTRNICELSTCNNEMLSCIGPGPKQWFHRVPVSEPNTCSGTLLTNLNFQGSCIPYIDKDVWNAHL